ncbi:hypothetical protein OIU79_000200 [Salix purpurea]|uniref:Uncharacterized protein n=1 Tax=Salix purpurea TaxID=77065 RepID=A0A9Q0V0N9_SALPP|nr:hypothetical protein OIU79_000200 [Salix purpurea]
MEMLLGRSGTIITTAPFYGGIQRDKTTVIPIWLLFSAAATHSTLFGLCFSHGVFSRVVSFNDPKAMLLFISQNTQGPGLHHFVAQATSSASASASASQTQPQFEPAIEVPTRY